MINSCYGAAGCDESAPARYGTLLSIKPVLYGHEPLDIYNYAREHPQFPHEPTRDQFFAES